MAKMTSSLDVLFLTFPWVVRCEAFTPLPSVHLLEDFPASPRGVSSSSP